MELRNLTSKDIFPMSKIISKIGIKEFKDAFGSDAVKALIAQGGKADVAAIGIPVALDIAGIILSNLSYCEKDLYAFLSELSGASVKDLQAISMADFAQMIIDLVQKEEFKDFFGVVSKLLNMDQ